MRFEKLKFALFLFLVLAISLACSLTGETPPDPASETPAAGGEAGSSSATVTGAAISNINLRSGPGTTYGIVGSLPAGEKATLVGRNEDSSWLVAETETGQVWLTGDPNLVKVEGGTIESLPVVEAPALAYDPSNPGVAMVLNQIPLVVYHEKSFTCASHAGVNNLTGVANGNVIGPHAGDFVFNGDNVLFKYINGSLHLIRENPIARFEGGAETLPFDRAMQLFQSGEIVWTGQLGQSPGRGVPGCDPAVK